LIGKLAFIVEADWFRWSRGQNFFSVLAQAGRFAAREAPGLRFDTNAVGEEVRVTERILRETRIVVFVQMEDVDVGGLTGIAVVLKVQSAEDLLAVDLIAVEHIGLIVASYFRDYDARGEGIEPPVLLFPAEFYRVEGPADVVPVESTDESFVAVAENLTSDLESQREVLGVADLEPRLAQVE
jgi:hypothetical protein